MKRSIATVCLSGDLHQKIEAVAAAGFDGIELFENDLMLFDESPAVVKRMAEDLGLEIVALQPFRDFECMSGSRMQKNFDRAERKFDLMEELGTDRLLICSNVSPQAIDSFERAVEDFSELAERAQKRRFLVGYEALAWGRYIRDYQQAWNIVKTVDHKHFGIILDSFHIFARGRDLSTIEDIPGHKIALIQVADAPWMDMDVLQWSRHFRCFPGQGDFPNDEFMEAVIRTGYDGYLSHEIFNDEFRSSPCKPTAIDGMRSMLWLQERIAIVAPDLAGPMARPGDYIPPEPSVEKVEFIEFAVESTARDQLIKLMTALGFEQTHKHRSKDVALYRLGDVSIVVNEEPDSFAQNYYLLHGVSVCAVAFSATDADGMAERAEYFGYRKFESDIESGELNIPGIKSVSGGLIYFVQNSHDGQRFIDVDFIPLDETQTPSSTVKSSMTVDHITSGMAESEFLSTSMFYRILFGLDIAQPQDLIDPYGIVVSRTATSRDKRIRLPFNMSRSWGASTERFREEHKGSGVQHIALHCEDLLALVQNIDPQIVLPIPANYYDDLEARFDLDKALMAKMRKYHVLYDQSETGHFLHFYTRSINGIFFEVVQREKYGNYGEVNAQVRMAAQARLRKRNV